MVRAGRVAQVILPERIVRVSSACSAFPAERQIFSDSHAALALKLRRMREDDTWLGESAGYNRTLTKARAGVSLEFSVSIAMLRAMAG